MLLRTLAGSRAGQIEDYSYEAARHALANGFAQPVGGERAMAAEVTRVSPGADVPAPQFVGKKRRFGALRKRS